MDDQPLLLLGSPFLAAPLDVRSVINSMMNEARGRTSPLLFLGSLIRMDRMQGTSVIDLITIMKHGWVVSRRCRSVLPVHCRSMQVRRLLIT